MVLGCNLDLYEVVVGKTISEVLVLDGNMKLFHKQLVGDTLLIIQFVHLIVWALLLWAQKPAPGLS